jgi:hypothetical protein
VFHFSRVSPTVCLTACGEPDPTNRGLKARVRRCSEPIGPVSARYRPVLGLGPSLPRHARASVRRTRLPRCGSWNRVFRWKIWAGLTARLRDRWKRWGIHTLTSRVSIPLESVAHIKGQLAVNPQHLHGAVDRVHVQQSYGTRRCLHGAQQFFVAVHNLYHLP